MTEIAVQLDRASPVPLGAQLSSQVRARITQGLLTPGERLPSSRALARDLGVARSVTEHAYAQLVAEGWLEGRHGSGTFVAAGGAATAPPRAARRTALADRPLLRLDTGTPWVDERHRSAWRRAWREVSVATPPPGYADPRGLLDLRVELAARLARTRGLEVEPDDVLVTSGTTDGFRHLLAGLQPGPVAVEDPGYRAAVETVRAAGREVVDLPALEPVTHLGSAVAAYVTPAHQHPLGPPMPGGRRLTLLATARAAGAVVVEDDYDSEFRYDVAPIPALASLDRDRVAYLGTASKSVAPSLRLGWLVVPPHLREAVDRHRALTHDGAAWPVQRAYLSLLRDGYVDRVVRAARRVYADRAVRVASALTPYVEGPVAGMYATVVLPRELAQSVHAAGRAAGLDVPLLSDSCRTSPLHGLVVGFGGCTEVELDRALAVIRDALQRG